MKVRDLINGIDNIIKIGSLNKTINVLSLNSKKTAKNMLFFCIDGTNTNGIIYLNEAIKNGANCVVLDKKYYTIFVKGCNKMLSYRLQFKYELNFKNMTYIFVDDVRKAMAIISANFYDSPQNKLKIIGITGTNGKTSCSYLIAELLKKFGKKVGVIGTSGIYIDRRKFEANMTTPDSIELFEIFSKMVKAKCEYCVMEVSAHAILYNKIYGINFCVKALTNVKSDHLDFFKTQQNYASVKQSFFKKSDLCVLNYDDKIGKNIAKNSKKMLNFGKNDAIFKVFNVKLSIGKTKFNVKFKNKTYIFETNLTGLFNVYNISLAVCVLISLGFEINKIVQKVKNLNCIAGRFDVVFKFDKTNIIIDYAHTLDSLKNVLTTIKKISKNKNIIVFGCPGERDTKKRFLMGRLATKFCDYVIFTSDNPASENPKRIMFEMEEGLKSIDKQTVYFKIENRFRAIQKAITIAKKIKNCNVLIVGKGTEKYQIVGSKMLPYCDYDAVNNILKKSN